MNPQKKRPRDAGNANAARKTFSNGKLPPTDPEYKAAEAHFWRRHRRPLVWTHFVDVGKHRRWQARAERHVRGAEFDRALAERDERQRDHAVQLDAHERRIATLERRVAALEAQCRNRATPTGPPRFAVRRTR
jgi:hypothetical protein